MPDARGASTGMRRSRADARIKHAPSPPRSAGERVDSRLLRAIRAASHGRSGDGASGRVSPVRCAERGDFNRRAVLRLHIVAINAVRGENPAGAPHLLLNIAFFGSVPQSFCSGFARRYSRRSLLVCQGRLSVSLIG